MKYMFRITSLLIVVTILLTGCATKGSQEFNVMSVSGESVSVLVPKKLRTDDYDLNSSYATDSYFCTKASLDAVVEELEKNNADYTFDIYGNECVLITDANGKKAVLKVVETEEKNDMTYNRLGFYSLWAIVSDNSPETAEDANKRIEFPVHLITGEDELLGDLSVGRIYAGHKYILLGKVSDIKDFYTQSGCIVQETESGFNVLNISVFDINNNSVEKNETEFIVTDSNGKIYIEYYL